MMIRNPFLDPNEPFPSHPLQTPFMGGSSIVSSQNNSLTNFLTLAPPFIDHESIVTIDFDQIQSLEENLRDFKGFLNWENVLPQVGNVVNIVRDILVSDKKGLEMLRVFSITVKNHAPMEDSPPQDN